MLGNTSAGVARVFELSPCIHTQKSTKINVHISVHIPKYKFNLHEKI